MNTAQEHLGLGRGAQLESERNKQLRFEDFKTGRMKPQHRMVTNEMEESELSASDNEINYEERNYKPQASPLKKQMILPEKFDGSGSLAVFLDHFNTCAAYNNWKEPDKRTFLRLSLRGNAALLLSTKAEKATSLKDMIAVLNNRYGTDSQILTL